MEKYLNFKVIINQDEDGFFVASCRAIPGCHTQGKTYEEAEKNIKEAIELCLKVAQEDEQYRKTIDFSEAEKPRFIGITNIMVKFSPSL